jgi:hypothetical protein
VTIELPNNDIARAASKGVDRRTLLKAGAWAAPVLVLTTAAPAMAASIEPVPKAQLTVSSYALSNLNNGGTPGPLSWAGGQISWSSPGTGQPTTASVSYTVVLSGPGGLSVNLATSATNISKYGSFEVPAIQWGVKPLASGDYTVTLTAIGSDGATSATSNTLAIPVTPVATASTPTVAPSGGNKHSVSFVLTGTPGAVVQVSAVYTNASADTAFPPSVTIPVGGSITVSGIANATGKTSGSVAITLTGNGSIVTPTSLSAVIPPKG